MGGITSDFSTFFFVGMCWEVSASVFCRGEKGNLISSDFVVRWAVDFGGED